MMESELMGVWKLRFRCCWLPEHFQGNAPGGLQGRRTAS